MSFAKLKKNRASAIEKLKQEAEKVSGGGKSYGDDRFWKPTRDKAGNAAAVIRFLPAPDGEELPWVRYWDHGFQGPTGRWYIENSLTSIGQDDPVSDLNSELWNRPGTEAEKEVDKQLVRDRKRRLHYVSNILVINDTANPENNGKTFLYKYGKKIFDKIQDVMQPDELEGSDPVNPFDFWEGADFKLRVRKVEGWINYDKSEFSKPSALSEDESELEAIYNGLYSLEDFIKPENYKTYAELKTKLLQVLGEEAAPSAGRTESARSVRSEDEDEGTTAEADDFGSEDAPAGDTESLDYFKSLADSDD